MYSRSDQPALGMSGVMESKTGSSTGAAVRRQTKRSSRSRREGMDEPQGPVAGDVVVADAHQVAAPDLDDLVEASLIGPVDVDEQPVPRLDSALTRSPYFLYRLALTCLWCA